MELMLLASVLFLATHLGVSSTALRVPLAAALGETGYLIAYSLVAAITLAYLIWIYAAQPHYDYFWFPSPELYLVPKLVMPVATTLLVGGFMVRNPTAIGGAGAVRSVTDPDRLSRGVIRVTRHPFQWAVALWAGSHLAANGDRASVIFFCTFLVLALAGGRLIDRRKAASLGADWERFARVTSNVPFAAIVAGRNRLVLRELAAPVAVGLLTYAGMFFGHPWLAGVRLI